MTRISGQDHSSPAYRTGKTGLRDVHRRSLMRLIFIATGLSLLVFAVLQVFNRHLPLALFELTASVGLLVSARRIEATVYLQWFVYTYLIAAFCFFLFIIAAPDSSRSAFVWVFMMPVMSYLLLGRKAGFFLAAPFMLAGGFFFYRQLAALDSARVMIDLLNPVFCGLLILLFMHLYENRRSDAQERLVSLAQTDALTGLSNRSYFQVTLARTINEAGRSKNRFALVLMDIDHFKRVNDTLGHDAGDEVLRHIGDCLGERLRNTDFVARLGGEEFGLILRDVDRSQAHALVEELRQRIEHRRVAYGDTDIQVTASFGVGFWPEDASRPNDLYQVADRRLYSAKHAGRNRIVDRDDSPTEPDTASAPKGL